MLIPLPFCQFYVLGGEPIRIPLNLLPQELGPYRELVQKRMDELQQITDRIAAGEKLEWPVPHESQAAASSSGEARIARAA